MKAMEMKLPYKVSFSSVGLWQRNDLMDIGVTVFWPGLNLRGALTQTVSLSGESEKKNQTTESSKQAGRLKVQLQQWRLFLFDLFSSLHSQCL